MEVVNKSALLAEAAMQTKMIRNLQRWSCLLIILSGIGIVFFWWGCNYELFRRTAQFGGSFLTVVSSFAAIIVQKGIKNGKKNIEKILCLAETKHR